MKLMKEIKWKCFMVKLRLGLMKEEVIHKYMRKNYCRYGVHHIRNSSISYGGTGQRMKHIRFLKCLHCNYMFFAKKTDKERYLKYGQKTKENNSALFEHLSSGKLKR